MRPLPPVSWFIASVPCSVEIGPANYCNTQWSVCNHSLYIYPHSSSNVLPPKSSSSPLFLSHKRAAMAKENNGSPAPHIAFLPTPGMGHLIPLGELAKRLVDLHGFTVTFITFAATASKAQSAFLASLPSAISSVALPHVPLADLPCDARIETVMSVAAVRSLPALRDILLRLKSSTRLAAFVADLFAADTFAVARDVGVAPYLFIPTNFMTASLMLHLPKLDAETASVEFRDLPEPVRVPGCVPLPGGDLLHPIQDKSNECYRWMVHHGERYRDAEGIMVNTFEDLEPLAKEFFFKSMEPGWPPIYPVGPLIKTGSPVVVGGSECLDWLSGQPTESVVFVSFGSGGTLSMEQTTELALGLEMSGQRFLWVVRTPDDGESSATYFSAGREEDPYGFLPVGFVERTKGVGLLVPGWAPQVQVLAHGATGGFLSHCGWNSTLEAVSHGVPMITWPLFAEQRQNAVMLAEVAKVALRLKAGDDGVYRREEIARVVRGLMEGEEGKAARCKAQELKEAAARALAESGSSYRALNEVANKWKKGSVDL